MKSRYIVPFVIAMAAGPALSAADYDDLPWTLRPYYEFTMGESEVRYAGDNGEWHVSYNGMGPIIKKARMEVHLADGRTYDTSTFDKGTESRVRAPSAQGEGVRYRVSLPIADAGLTAQHAFFVNSNRPFYVIHTKVTNTGDKPVEVARISPAILPPGSLATLSPNVEYRVRPLDGRGTWPMYDGVAGSLSVGLFDTAKSFNFVMGPLPKGRASSTAELHKGSGGWQGEVRCEFDPPVMLDPGESIEADPVWICFAVPDADDMERLFSWSHAERPRAPLNGEVPKAWATMPAHSEWRELSAAQRAWATAGVEHVLIPLGWEHVPGSLAGGGGGYPDKMGIAARSIRQAGGIPGLTIDPMAATSGDGSWSARSDDGQLWLDLQDPKAFAVAVSNMQQVASWGFEFFVVPKSDAPDEILKHFKMTRREAQALGLKAMEAAASGRPVLPAPIGAIGNDLNAWVTATAAAQLMNDYEMPVGPVRLDPTATGGFDRDVVAAITEYHGPIEFVGQPSARVRSSLAGAFDSNPRDRAANQRAAAEAEAEAEAIDEAAMEADTEAEAPEKEKKRRFRFRIPGLGGKE